MVACQSTNLWSPVRAGIYGRLSELESIVACQSSNLWSLVRARIYGGYLNDFRLRLSELESMEATLNDFRLRLSELESMEAT